MCVSGFICDVYFGIERSSSSFVASGRLCFKIVAFPSYPLIYFEAGSATGQDNA